MLWTTIGDYDIVNEAEFPWGEGETSGNATIATAQYIY